MKSILILVALILSTVARAADLPRVAVIPEDANPELANFADLLATALGGASGQYTLVERAEIQRLAAEAEVQKLQAAERPLALAKLAKADGLMLVGMNQREEPPKLHVRLVATSNGLITRVITLGGAPKEFDKAAGLVSGVMRFACERLGGADSAPPVVVSLLGLRPAFEADKTLEITLNTAVAQQLSAQSGLAVAERWRLQDVQFERALAEAPQPALATGTVLLEGSYVRRDQDLVVDLRLRGAESAEGKSLQVTGQIGNPVALAAEIARVVAKESGLSGQAMAWDARAEGKQFAELGWWLLSRKLGEESARAYESAVALGLDKGFPLLQRAWAYERMIDPEANFAPARTEVGDWTSLDKATFRKIVLASIREAQCMIAVLDSQWAGLTQKEYSRDDRYCSLQVSFAQQMQVLQAICLRGEQLELAHEARALRALSRELVVKGEVEIKNNCMGEVVQRMYMYDTPHDAAADLRVLLSPKKMGDEHWSKGRWLRGHFWDTCDDHDLWRMVDWSSTDNKGGAAAWNAFIAELQSSKDLLSRADGFSFAFQQSRGEGERDRILVAYCDMLEQSMDQVLTPDGQRAFYGFCDFNGTFFRPHTHAAHPAYHARMARILQQILDRADWLQPAAITMLRGSSGEWRRHAERRGQSPVPKEETLALLAAVEKYIARAKSDPRWQKQYKNPHFGDVAARLTGVVENLIYSYPGLREERIKVRPPVAGAIPIRSWVPGLPGVPRYGIWMDGDHMLAHGSDLLVPSPLHGLLVVDTGSMAVKRTLELPMKGEPICGLSANDQAVILTCERRLFTRPFPADGGAWQELVTGSSPGARNLQWIVQGVGDAFFVGSSLHKDDVSPLMLAGIARDGKLDWLAASNRRPAVNPLDNMDPRKVLLARRNAAGKTMVLLENQERAPLVELETGRVITAFQNHGKTQTRGEMPLYWIFDNERVEMLAAIDPAQDDPLLLFKPTDTFTFGLPDSWKDAKPIHDSKRPEFQGIIIAPIIHDGFLWLLKREADIPGGSEENGPHDFRLVRVPVRGGAPVVIPLRWAIDVPDAIRKRAERDETSLDRPVLNDHSLTATRNGLFFTPSGHGYGNGIHYNDGLQSGGELAPLLLHVTWDDINAWINNR